MVSLRCFQLLEDLRYSYRRKYGQPFLNRLKAPEITLISQGFVGSEELCRSDQFF